MSRLTGPFDTVIVATVALRIAGQGAGKGAAGAGSGSAYVAVRGQCRRAGAGLEACAAPDAEGPGGALCGPVGAGRVNRRQRAWRVVLLPRGQGGAEPACPYRAHRSDAQPSAIHRGDAASRHGRNAPDRRLARHPSRHAAGAGDTRHPERLGRPDPGGNRRLFDQNGVQIPW